MCSYVVLYSVPLSLIDFANTNEINRDIHLDNTLYYLEICVYLLVHILALTQHRLRLAWLARILCKDQP